MLPLYNLLSLIGIVFYSPWIFFKKGPEDKSAFVRERFGIADYDKTDIWVHAVSVGEVLACVPFLNALKQNFPSRKIVLSTTTYTGQKIARTAFPGADRIMYMPVDAIVSTKRVVNRLRPDVFITVETELWPALFQSLKQCGSRVIILNGRISKESYSGYRKIKFFMKELLSYVDFLSMQSEDDAKRIIEIGADPEKVGVMGNLKFDISFKNAPALSWLEDIRGPILLAASTHKGEEEIVLDAYAVITRSIRDVKLILAPRHPERFNEVGDILDGRGLAFVRRTEIQGPGAGGQGPATENGKRKTGNGEPSIILLDTIGELPRVFSKISIAFIGGSLVPHGGHNILEPAYWGRPMIFGPHMDNFPFAGEFIEKSAALRVTNSEDMADSVSELLGNAEKAVTMGMNARAIINENTGAVHRAIELVRGFLGTP
jgi:3-deoxy-D-manno-octulosonic-acid transferase